MCELATQCKRRQLICRNWRANFSLASCVARRSLASCRRSLDPHLAQLHSPSRRAEGNQFDPFAPLPKGFAKDANLFGRRGTRSNSTYWPRIQATPDRHMSSRALSNALEIWRTTAQHNVSTCLLIAAVAVHLATWQHNCHLAELQLWPPEETRRRHSIPLCVVCVRVRIKLLILDNATRVASRCFVSIAGPKRLQGFKRLNCIGLSFSGFLLFLSLSLSLPDGLRCSSRLAQHEH